MTQVLEQYNSISQVVRASIGTELGQFWSDTDLGSKIDEIQKGKITNQSILALKAELKDCIQFLVDDGRAKEIKTQVLRFAGDKNRLSFVISVMRPDEITEEIALEWGLTSN